MGVDEEFEQLSALWLLRCAHADRGQIRGEGGGNSWRCHSCHQTWTDREYLPLQAS